MYLEFPKRPAIIVEHKDAIPLTEKGVTERGLNKLQQI